MNNLSAVFMLDLSAAFDTVDHHRLLVKLHDNFNIRDEVLKWLKSYLENRTSSVVVNGNVSDKISVVYGVPQGSILGPLLFILYINDLNSLGGKFGLTVHSYADDTTLYLGFEPNSEFQDACVNIKNCLSDIQQWMQINFLQLNINKTQLLICGKPRIIKMYQSQILDLQAAMNIDLNLSATKTSKLLGVNLDSNMSFTDMVN